MLCMCGNIWPSAADSKNCTRHGRREPLHTGSCRSCGQEGKPRGLQHPERFFTRWEGADSLIWVSWHLKKPKSRLELTILVCNSVCGWQPAADPCWPLGRACSQAAGEGCVFLRLEVFVGMDLPDVWLTGSWTTPRNKTRVHYLAERGKGEVWGERRGDEKNHSVGKV